MSAQDQIIDLKRQAVALKESGDVNGAMALLAQARDLEFENATIDDLWEPLKLKQFAVVMKKRGDLDAARQALMKSKQIEKGEIVQGQQQASLQEPPQEQAPTPPTAEKIPEPPPTQIPDQPKEEPPA